MTLVKNYTNSCVLLLLSTFFRSEYSFTVILNVIEQTDIYQHFKYGTILVLED